MKDRVVASGSVEDEGWMDGRAVISISGSWWHAKMGPDMVFTVPHYCRCRDCREFPSEPVLLMTYSTSGGVISSSGLVAPPHLSGTEDFDWPAWEWDRNTILWGGMVWHFPVGLLFPLAGERWRPSPAKPENQGGSRDGSAPFPC